jgi:RNA polymerase sigma-70 factor (ECF subfamily)
MSALAPVDRAPSASAEQDLLLGSLLDACARGNASALAALFDQTACAALQVARCASGDERVAEQAVHDAFVEVWRRAAAGRVPRRDVGLWVLALAHRHAKRAAVAA